MGDPGGIGAEVVLKALAAGVDQQVVIYGSEQVLRMERDALVGAGVVDAARVDEALDDATLVGVAPKIQWDKRPVGPTGADGAVVQGRALDRAMEDAQQGRIDAIVTAPWNKALFAANDEPAEGHTERLARFFGVDDVVMMLGGDRLRVALVTTHIPLADVAPAIDETAITTTVKVVIGELRRWFGIEEPRVAVCGLNPHAGEQGHMGREEIEVVEPAVDRLASHWQGDATVEGPFPSDTLFAKFRDAAPYDAVVCMYHDQGLIPLKLLHFGASANITLGLPVVRTSVDHGTAYDIAGDGVADAGSMRYALQTAAAMVRRGM